MTAYYRALVKDYLVDQSERILDDLIKGDRLNGFSQLSHEQVSAWKEQLQILSETLKEICKGTSEAYGWGVLFEYTIPRRDKRVDVVILASSFIAAIEFKSTDRFTKENKSQAEDYALDLHYYHRESNHKPIIPILCATRARELYTPHFSSNPVHPLQLTSGHTLTQAFASLHKQFLSKGISSSDVETWEKSPYRPIPSIIEAACKLYAGNTAVELKRTYADANTLLTTTERLIAIINDAKENKKKIACFVTGVPGSGKTLIGLNAIHSKTVSSGTDSGVFVSGNGPLVKILSEVLARDYSNRKGVPLNESRSTSKTFIQSLHSYIEENLRHSNPPPDHVVVFDEAQRAWDAEKISKMAKRLRRTSENIAQDAERMELIQERTLSEPERMLTILDRHSDWGVIVALIGTGQEIHDGETGINGWFDALSREYKDWHVYVSTPACNLAKETNPSAVDTFFASNLNHYIDDNLHLTIPIRLHSKGNVSDWVNACLKGDAALARTVYDSISDYPLFITRDLEKARDWLMETTTGTRRCGLLASSSAGRLRPYGIEVSSGFRKEVSYELWFTGPKEDMRSSYALEVAATEFECQGLELDRVCLCWGGDFVRDPENRKWIYQGFRGQNWAKIKSEIERNYLLNTYRVLLTRAREGLILWIPQGKSHDHTRSPAMWDSVYKFLKDCGVKDL